MYDWRTDEDEEWTGQQSREENRPVSRRWLWLFIPAILLLIGVGIYWQVNQRLEETTEQLRQDVLSSHDLVQQAIDNQDLELLTTLLSGREPEWTEAQRQLVSEDYWSDFPLFGWTQLRDEARERHVSFDSDLRQATLLESRTFIATDSSSTPQAIELFTTRFYRRGETRWLLSPPEETYWGNDRQIANSFVSVTAPARDADFARLVAAGLAERVGAICGEYTGLCGGGNGPVPITFSTDPESALLLSSRELYLANIADEIFMPTVSLVGNARTEEATNALVTQYEYYIMTALVARWSEYACCEQGLYFLALADFVLSENFAEVDLATAADYLMFAGAINNTGALQTLFDEPINSIRPDRWLVYGWVDYILQSRRTELLPAAIKTLNSASDFDSWTAALDTAVPGSAAQSTPINDRSVLLTANQGIVILCEDPGPSLHIFDTLSGQWNEALAPINAQARGANLQPFPNQDGFFAAFPSLSGDAPEWMAQVWTNQGGLVTFDSSNSVDPLRYAGLHDPAGERLLVYLQNADSGDIDFQLLDLDDCQTGNCPLREVDGLPIWSPSGRQSVVLQGANLWRGDENGDSQERLYRALFPFWLTEDVFGFLRAVRFSDDSGALVAELAILASSFGWEPEERLGNITLANFIDEAPADLRLKIERAETHPYLSDTLIVTSSDANRQTFYILEITGLAAGDDVAIEPLFISDKFPARIHYSSDSRWMGVTTFADEQTNLDFWIVDRVLGRQLPPLTGQLGQPIENNHWVHWSANGELVMLLSAGELLVYRPVDNASVTVDIPFNGCRDAIWLADGGS